ncbi:MAG: IS4 family transposase, partial [Lacunisphaera sp.]|nr:IS4 family transposase [Lacunisphaera sp.]
MNEGKTVFAQVMACVPHWEFRRVVAAHDNAIRIRSFSAWDHFLAMSFAQLTFRESLRDIEACLDAQPQLRHHLGFRSRVTRSTLARVNEHRPWQLFAALAQKLIQRAREVYREEPHVLDLQAPVYALDATFIDLSLALCPWANWTGSDATLKLHTMLDLRVALPVFATITEGSYADVRWLDQVPIEPGSYLVMDRGYIDFRRLRRIAQAGAFFVVRDRCDVKYYTAQSRPVDRTTAVRSDQTIRFNGTVAARLWPERMRRVSIYDFEHHRRLVFWTNVWDLPAATIAELYRQRWQIELFFRWIKENLRLRSFYGTSPNAIRVQIWTAISAYLASALARRHHHWACLEKMDTNSGGFDGV